MNFYPPKQFALFRIAFGIYLAVFFIYCLPFSKDLFSNQGMLPVSFAMPFPNFLFLLKDVRQIQISLIFLGGLSVFFALGFKRRVCAVLIWYGYACLLNRLPTVTIPSQSYVGWFLLASVLIPGGEPLSLSKKNMNWSMPPLILFGAWLVLAAGYSFSGIDKLKSPSWVNGEALTYIFQSPVVFNGFLKKLFLSLPTAALKTLTWFSLLLEVLYLPLCIFDLTRKLAWHGMVLLHLIVLLAFDIRAVSLFFLLAHFFVLDFRWFPHFVPQRGIPNT